MSATTQQSPKCLDTCLELQVFPIDAMAQQQYPHLGGLENLMTFNMAAEEFSFYACDHDSDSSKVI